MKVGILGPLLTYTHQAALQHYGEGVEIVPYPTIDEVFAKVEAGTVDEGVVPEENVIEGTVRPTIDGYYNRRVHLVGKTVLPISHYLGALPDTALNEITEVMTKAEAFSQCSKWLAQNIPTASNVPTNSTADAARLIMEGQLTNAAAIAPELALNEMGLKVLAANVGNVAYNKTLFGIISGGLLTPEAMSEPTGNDETTIIIHPSQDYAGQLERYLHAFSQHGISLTRMESRPGIVSRTPSDLRGERMTYLFPFSLKGHFKDADVGNALMGLTMDIALFEGTAVKLVGSHPRVELYNGKS